MSSSIVDAARRLDWKRPLWQSDDGEVHCVYCNGMNDVDDNGFVEFGHAIDCPILAMPKIVAALELAESLASTFDNMDTAMFEVWDGLKALRAALAGED